MTLIVLVWSSLALRGEIHDAARNGDFQKIKALLRENPELVSIKDEYGYTPLHLAARKGQKDAVEMLLANKAEINAKTLMGITPLDMAAWDGYKGIEELLRQNGGVNGVVGLYEPGDGVQSPIQVTWTPPLYTVEARRKCIEGTVILQGIVRKDGTVTDLKVIKKLGYGLEESIIDTITTKWRFKPGTRNGEPVDVISNYVLNLRNTFRGALNIHYVAACNSGFIDVMESVLVYGEEGDYNGIIVDCGPIRVNGSTMPDKIHSEIDIIFNSNNPEITMTVAHEGYPRKEYI
jgi:TonB family protein